MVPLDSMPTNIMSSHSLRNRNGFSLLELLVVLAVLGAASVLAIPRIAGAIVKAKTTQCAVNRTVLERAEERYRADHDGQPSAGLEELRTARYMDRVPKCSEGGYYIWISTSTPVKMGCSTHEWPAVSPR